VDKMIVNTVSLRDSGTQIDYKLDSPDNRFKRAMQLSELMWKIGGNHGFGKELQRHIVSFRPLRSDKADVEELKKLLS
jgi:hypothetical protein